MPMFASQRQHNAVGLLRDIGGATTQVEMDNDVAVCMVPLGGLVVAESRVDERGYVLASEIVFELPDGIGSEPITDRERVREHIQSVMHEAYRTSGVFVDDDGFTSFRATLDDAETPMEAKEYVSLLSIVKESWGL